MKRTRLVLVVGLLSSATAIAGDENLATDDRWYARPKRCVEGHGRFQFARDLPRRLDLGGQLVAI